MHRYPGLPILSSLVEQDRHLAISLAAKLPPESLSKVALDPMSAWTWDRHMASESHHMLRILCWLIKFKDAPKSFDGVRKAEMPTESHVPDFVKKMRDEAIAEAEANDPEATRTLTIEEAEQYQQYLMNGMQPTAASKSSETSESLPKKETLSAEQIFKKIQL